MPKTVNAAFEEFMRLKVNLDAAETVTARASRDWLAAQLQGLHVAHGDFPRPYEDQDVYIGSFHRRSKIRPLDDIDLLSCMSAEGSIYTSFPGEIQINVQPEADRLLALCHDNTNVLNSRKVINQFVKRLSAIPQYRRAEIGRDGEAAVLSLESYPWSFDVVPAMFTKPEHDGRTYYLIPDGSGHWKKTDPRIDQERITRVNQAHDGNVLPAMRLMKYWNNRQTKPRIRSYGFEQMVLSHYVTSVSKASGYIDLEVAPILLSLATAVLGVVPDPKGIQGDLNHLPLVDRLAVSMRATRDANTAALARAAENTDEHDIAIRLWAEIFGPEFPSYG